MVKTILFISSQTAKEEDAKGILEKVIEYLTTPLCYNSLVTVVSKPTKLKLNAANHTLIINPN